MPTATARPTGVAAWIHGARPRTLPAAIVPVAVGTGVAAALREPVWWRAGVALVVALALQVGVNYANDYSDGVRGTDETRVGPTRLVAGGLATPRAVLLAALSSFAVAAFVGLALVAATGDWWLVLVGAGAIAAAWFYTGGKKPYGYRALGEVGVFVFFGLVAVVGTTFVQIERFSALAVAAAVPVGSLACALLIVNNIRDVDGDRRAGKRTLAVVVGDARARWLYIVTVALPFVAVLALGVVRPWALLALLAVPLAAVPIRRVARGARGRDLILALRDTAIVQLGFGALLTAGLFLS